MWFLPSQEAGLYAEYREDLRVHRMPEAVRTAALVVFTLNVAFVGLDWYAFPDEAPGFLLARMVLNVVLGVVYFATSRSHPVGSQSVLCMATGGLLLWVIYGSGAPMGDYYVGLMLALVGLPVLLPLDPTRAAVMWSILVAGFVVSPLVVEGPIDSKAYAIHSLFLASGAFTGVASSVYLTLFRLRDFAKRREIEAAHEHLKETDRVKSRFTANVHHELRTPLTLTLAPLEAILSGEFGEVPEVLRGYLQTMHANALRLLKLINNLLDLAKVEGQQFTLRRQHLDVAKIVESIVDGARPLAARKDVELRTRFEADLPSLYVDADAVEKVVVNLVGNALKFTDAGGHIEAGLSSHEEGVLLVVADTGTGLPEDQLERIFDRFAQVDTSATRKHEGTGIGLSLVKELVELHGGRVWAESPGLGHGTRMHVLLPPGSADEAQVEEIVEDESGRAVDVGASFDGLAAEIDLPSEGTDPNRLVELANHVVRQEESAEEDGEPLRVGPEGAPEIVVAEDNADMRRLLGALLGRDYRLRLTRNGREALEAVRHLPPDLVLTDVMMPEMSGTELCKALKSDPATRSIPVMLVTSKADREMKIEGLELGADDYVTKPFHPRELKARVGGMLTVRALQKELAIRNAKLESTLVELRAAEVQLVQSERLAAVGELAAGVAHEVNNPVNFALNAARALRGTADEMRQLVTPLASLDGREPEVQARQVEKLCETLRDLDFEDVVQNLAELSGIVTDGLERTERLVGDLRDFTRSERTGTAPVDVRKGLRSTLRLLEPTFHDENVEVSTDFAEDLPMVQADSGALNQVYLNLIKNAVDAFEEGGGAIRVSAHRHGRGSLRIEIADDGPGIPEEAADRLFEPFFTTKSAGRGSGLGLSICQRIVNAHGGSIELLPGKGGGSVARVSLPVVT